MIVQMVSSEKIRDLLAAFAALFTQPIDQQDLQTSLRSAEVSIGLVALGGFISLIQNGVRSAGEIVGVSLLAVLLWMLGTSVVVRGECRKLVMAQNLSLLSFWIAATLVLVSLAVMLYPDPLDRGIRFLITAALIGVLVPVHLLRSMRSRPAAFWWMIPALWITMDFLAWHVID